MHALTRESLAATAAELVDAVRRRGPRVHAITNTVAQTYTANLLLAAGAVPSMTTSPDEAAVFTASADALLVNLGTFDAERRSAIPAAIAAARAKPIPWVLDPVLIDRSPARAAFARLLATEGPAAIRGNAAEIACLGEVPGVVAATGTVDVIAEGCRRVALANGVPAMAKVTALGCAEAALVAAFLAVGDDPMSATAAAILAVSVAAEVASEGAAGPGSLAIGILDALANLDRATLLARAKVQ